MSECEIEQATTHHSHHHVCDVRVYFGQHTHITLHTHTAHSSCTPEVKEEAEIVGKNWGSSVRLRRRQVKQINSHEFRVRDSMMNQTTCAVRVCIAV